MELVKTNENWRRSFDADGAESGSTLENVQFDVKDEGNVLGSANVNQWNGNANIDIPEVGHADINVNGYASIEKGVETLKAVMGMMNNDE